MQIKFKGLKGLSQSSSSQQQKIFGEDFRVQEMSDPSKFLPRYQQNQNTEQSLNEQCLICCGNICMICVAPFGCCCCQNCCSCTVTVPTAQAGLVQSFGKFSRLLKPGFNLINPCSEEVKYVDLKTRIVSVGRHSTITKDNVKLTIQASIAFRITNPIIAHYILGVNMNRALAELTTSTLREVIGDYNLDSVLGQRMKLVKQAKQQILQGMPQGIHVENIFLEDISVPPEVENDLNSAAKQKRISEANIINSKADVQSAALMKQSAELLDTKAAMQIRYLQMVTQLGQRGCVLMMPIGSSQKGFRQGS